MRRIGPETRVYAVLGRPIRHSLSPRLHNRWFEQCGLDAVYVAQDVDPDRASDLMTALRTLDFAGVNLTVPLKQAVVHALDVVDDDVRITGAANTLVRRDGRWHGHNTDVQGYIAGLHDNADIDLAGRRVVLLGAGGAALAVAKGLLDAGVDHIDVCNRTVRRAQTLCSRLAQRTGTLDAHPLDAAPRLAVDADLVVNALSGPGAATADAIDPTRLSPRALWSDLNYWMDAPPGAVACRSAGVPFVDGFGMLAHQAAIAFHHFTGTSPPEVPNRYTLE